MNRLLFAITIASMDAVAEGRSVASKGHHVVARTDPDTRVTPEIARELTLLVIVTFALITFAILISPSVLSFLFSTPLGRSDMDRGFRDADLSAVLGSVVRAQEAWMQVTRLNESCRNKLLCEIHAKKDLGLLTDMAGRDTVDLKFIRPARVFRNLKRKYGGGKENAGNGSWTEAARNISAVN